MPTVASPYDVLLSHTLDLTVGTPAGMEQASTGVPGFQVTFDWRATPTMTRTAWRFQLVESDGTVISEMPEAVVSEITEVLNEPTRASFTIPRSSDAGRRLLAETKMRELRVWRGDTVVFWGPVTRIVLDGDIFACEAADPRWYLGRRFIGGEVENHFTNPDFASGTASWGWLKGTFDGWAVSLTSPDTTEVTHVPTPTMPGTSRSARLWNDDDDPDTYIQIFQDETFTAGDFPLTVTQTAWARLSSDQYDTGTVQTRGIMLQRLKPGASIPLGYYNQNEAVAEAPIVVQDFPLDQWVRLSASVEIPAGQTRTVHATLGCPEGQIVYWARATLTTDAGLEFDDDDQASIIRTIVAHLQDSDFSKSDVNVTCSAATAPPTGVTRSRRYPYRDHQNGWSAIREFTEVDDGIDTWMTYTSTARYLHVAPSPGGSHRPAARFFYGRHGGNCVLHQFARDMEQAASRVFVMSADGSPREEGHDEDTTAFSGCTLELLSFADRETTSGLADMATERLTVGTQPETMALLSLPGSNVHLHGLNVGDTVPVDIALPNVGTADAYSVDKAEDWRVLSKSWQPQLDIAQFVLGPR